MREACDWLQLVNGLGTEEEQWYEVSLLVRRAERFSLFVSAGFGMRISKCYLHW